MSLEYNIERINFKDATSVEICSELYKRRIQLIAYEKEYNVHQLKIYIKELESQDKISKELSETRNEIENPFYKVLMIISIILLIVFGTGSIYLGSVFLAFAAFLDLLICLIAYFNYREQKIERRMKL